MGDPALLRIYLLGEFRVVLGERAVPDTVWRRRRPAALLKILALSPGFRVHREQLFEILWPDLDIRSAGNNLNVTVHEVRRTLTGGDAVGNVSVERFGETVVLGPRDGIWVDAVEFQMALSDAWRSADPGAFWRAVDLYTGDLLPDDPFDEWIERRRTALRTSYLTALSRLAVIHHQHGHDSAEIAAYTRLLDAEPLDEDTTRSLMRCLARVGQRSRALAQYEVLAEALSRELGVEPEQATRDLYQGLLDDRTETSGLPQVVPARAPESAGIRDVSRRSNLPAELTPLIGREQEIAELAHHLSVSRLVTLTGPGGVGKTALALTVAREVSEDFNHVFHVSLDRVRDPQFVLPAIARTLGLQESPGQSTAEALTAYLGDKNFLLLLDNFEQVVDAAPDLAHMLARCPHLKILVTSRTRLRLQGEHEYSLSPLSLPARHDSGPALDRFSAVALFQTRARQVRPDIEISQPRLSTISEICHRLDGLPLAIELAAVRCKVLTPEALLPLLERRLTVLTGGARDLPERQQTIRGTIAWSYELLGGDAQRLFRHLSVFVGGWDLESAEAVTVGPPGIDDGPDVLDLLFALVDQSLVLVDEQNVGAPRFRMLETIREFGLEQLKGGFEEASVRRRHAHYFAELVSTSMSFMYGADQVAWLDRLEQEHANIQTALDWFLNNDLAKGLRMVGPLWLPWWIRNHFSIGRHYYDAFLAAVDDATVDDITYAHALTGAGIITEWQGETERATSLAQKALSIWLDLSHPPDGSYWSFICLGNLALNQSNLPLAERWYKQGLDFARHHGHEYGVSALLDCLARVAAIQGQFERAELLYRTSLVEARKRGDAWSISLSTGNLGFMLMTLGRYEEARPLLDEGLETAERLGLDMYRVETLGGLGILHVYLGELERGEALLNESIAIAIDTADFNGISRAKLGLAMVAHRRGEISEAERFYLESIDQTTLALDLTTIPSSIDGLATVYADLGQFERAVRFHAFAMAFREQTGINLTVNDQELTNASMARARSALLPEAIDHAWSEGLAMTLEEIRSELAPSIEECPQDESAFGEQGLSNRL